MKGNNLGIAEKSNSPFRYDRPVAPPSRTTLNDIPNGTVFEGSVWTKERSAYTVGVWLKVADQGKYGAGTVMAVLLTGAVKDNGQVRYHTRCTEVTGYRALKNPRIVEGD